MGSFCSMCNNRMFIKDINDQEIIINNKKSMKLTINTYSNKNPSSYKNESNKLLDSFSIRNFKSPITIRSLFPTPKQIIGKDRESNSISFNSKHINNSNDNNNDNIKNILEDTIDESVLSTSHKQSLNKVLSFQIPQHVESFQMLDKNSLINTRRQSFQCHFVDDDDSGKEVNRVVIQTFDYSKNSAKKQLTRFHSFSHIVDDDNNRYVKKHTCDLCSLSFDDEPSFINHTKYSKIHEIALLTYRARQNNHVHKGNNHHRPYK